MSTTSPTEVFRRGGKTTSIRFSRCKLRISVGPDEGTECPLERSKLRIGTSAGCDLVLTDQTVSRNHCELEVTEKGFLLRDLDSTNGTFIGDVRVREAFVLPGMTFSIGKDVAEFVATEEPVEIRLSSKNTFGDVIGTSIGMREIFYLLERVVTKDVTVLLQGETGTGKEVFARSIHKMSTRARGPFLTVDCGAIPDNLIESELFGHAKGAFTGATQDRVGVFEQANGGTVFLDEVGELPPAQQTALLRVLESREIRRLGEAKTRKVDVRVVAATNRSLADEVAAERFRKDLFYRLSVVLVHVPPLRERPEDIELLARQFLADMGAPVTALSETAMSVLKSHAWPGNIRELRNVLERAWVLSDKTSIEPSTVLAGAMHRSENTQPVTTLTDGTQPLAESKEAFEKAYLVALLKKHELNVSQAAKTAGIHRQSLHRLMKKHGINLGDLQNLR